MLYLHDALPILEIETGEPAKNYFVTAREGAYIDSLFITDGNNMSANLVIGRTGNFEVTIGGDKYVTWNKKNVTVSSDGCHPITVDRKSTRLNSSHVAISYAVFCLKKKKNRLIIYILF